MRDAGIALDGDGDRLIMADKEGNIVDGDQILYILARDRKEKGTLKGPVVGTAMSNLGLELALKELGIGFKRTQVGDRYVHEELIASGGILGAEPSGHILCLDKATTGDGIVSALQVLSIMKKSGQKPCGACRRDTEASASIRRCARQRTFSTLRLCRQFRREIAAVEKELGDNGRVVIRASGTEPLIRIMVEAREESIAKKQAERLAGAVRHFAES
jgi:phosphoglucosamine mutase